MAGAAAGPRPAADPARQGRGPCPRPGSISGMSRWRQRLVLAASRITANTADHFRLPRESTVIMGVRIGLPMVSHWLIRAVTED